MENFVIFSLPSFLPWRSRGAPSPGRASPPGSESSVPPPPSVENISERPSSRSHNSVNVSSTQFEIEPEECNQKESTAFILEVVKMKSDDNQAFLTKPLGKY